MTYLCRTVVDESIHVSVWRLVPEKDCFCSFDPIPTIKNWLPNHALHNAISGENHMSPTNTTAVSRDHPRVELLHLLGK